MSDITAVYTGDFIHTPSFGRLELLQDVSVAVNTDGRIASITNTLPELPSDVLHVRLSPNQFVIPGFVDLHTHAPQYQYSGTATDKPLMQWLDAYAFPAEKRLRDPELARGVYERVVRRLLRLGTTTAVYFATADNRPCEILVDVVEALGQRGYIGKVCLDQHTPSDYVQGTAQALAESEAFVEFVAAKRTPLVQPVLTPRFTPTCSVALMRGLADLAARYDVLVQSHISESHDEVDFAWQVHGQRDAALFRECGLLTGRALMAHGVHLTDSEWDALREHGTAVAHCPTSHFYFADGMVAVKPRVLRGNRVGLGTDVAGGYSPSMLSAIRNAVLMSRAIQHASLQGQQCAANANGEGPPCVGTAHVSDSTTTPPQAPAEVAMDYIEAFWLATLGGAEALGLQHCIGSFGVGKAFDAVLVALPAPEELSVGTAQPLSPGAASHIDIFPTDSLEDRFQKFVNLGDERDIAAVWVQGRRVVGHG